MSAIGEQLSRTKATSDRFVAFQDGKRIAAATIRLQLLEHIAGVDLDCDGVPDTYKVPVAIADLSSGW